MPGTIFWDVDTQYDFITPDGKLYVNGAEAILPNLARLTGHARRRGIPIFGSVDSHTPGDPELSSDPDFRETFPPHCLQGAPGSEKVPETRPENPLWIDPEPIDPDALIRKVQNHRGEIFFRKRRFDVFTNPNVEPVLNAVRPDRIVVYGVALDVCDACAIDGFLRRKTAPVTLVLDAAHAIDPERGKALVQAWRSQGVAIARTGDITGE